MMIRKGDALVASPFIMAKLSNGQYLFESGQYFSKCGQ